MEEDDWRPAYGARFRVAHVQKTGVDLLQRTEGALRAAGGSIRSYGFRPDTGGPGRFRGGCGLYRTFDVEPEAYLYAWFERSKTPAWGLFGGRDAVGPDVVVNPGRGDERHLLKTNAHLLAPGSIVHMQTGGGGGFGDPRERDPERVRADVRNGFVTLEGAERDYGVVLDPNSLELRPAVG